MKMDKVRWGVISTGGIARTFSKALQAVPSAELAAVASRTDAAARAFASEFGFRRAWGSYEDLAKDPEVDIIYVATPHSRHCEDTLLCLDQGKAVLCEKPLAVNAGQARQMINTARDRGCYLMEAMWTRFLPITAQVRTWLRQGAIGEVKMLCADFGICEDFPPEGRMLNPHLAGGALLDLGVYPIAYASMVFGERPAKIISDVLMADTGVDARSACVFTYDAGQMALLSSALDARTPLEALICGTLGRIRVMPPFWGATEAVLSVDGRDDKHASLPFGPGLTGYVFQARAVTEDILAGRKENALMPLDESLAVMETMDDIRRQWNFKYPCEQGTEHP